MLVVDKGELTYPAPPYQPPELPKPKELAPPPPPPPEWVGYAKTAAKLTVLASVLVGLGAAADAELSMLLSVFALAGAAPPKACPPPGSACPSSATH